jgi:hypothetical protein
MTSEMIRTLARAAAVAALGALGGAILIVAGYAIDPGVTLEMDRDLPRLVSGIYPPERDRDLTFAWSSDKSTVRLPGLDRRAAWICSLRFRGGRAQPPQPHVELAIDGITLASRVASNEYEELEARVPQLDRPGMTLTIRALPTVVPGPQDPRELGIQIDRIACRPEGGSLALPPRRAITRAMLAAAGFGAAFALLRITAGAAIGATLLVAAAQALPFSIGLAPFGAYPAHALRLALWIAALMVVAAHALETWKGERLRQTARFAIAFSAAALYLKLLALIHPSKPIVDALFQAHRFEWVLAGRYYFTQVMPGGVNFPYAIGLYVFALPWSYLTRDYVTLLRIVVTASEVVAGGLLYVAVARTWGDRLAAAVATALFSLVPMTYWFVGAANQTNVFGQSVALATMVLVTALALRPGQWRHVIAVVAVAAWAMLCHVSTFATLVATLALTAAFYWLLGGPALRAPAKRIVAGTILAVLVAIVAYYGHFGAVYKDALRVRAQAAAASQAAPAEQTPAPGQLKYRTFTPLHIRLADALLLSVRSVGWPILLLATAGAWRAWVQLPRDRLMCAILAWTATYAVFLAIGVMRVDTQYQRYSYEFVGRATFATYPAAVILAAYGAAWAWRAGRGLRIASAVLLVSAVVLGVQNWLQWIQ